MRNDETQIISADIFSGVPLILLENGDEAVYIHGLFLECADIAQGDRPLADIAARLAGLQKIPFRQITLPVPGNIRGPAASVTGTTGTYRIFAAYWPCTLNDAGTATARTPA